MPNSSSYWCPWCLNDRTQWQLLPSDQPATERTAEFQEVTYESIQKENDVGKRLNAHVRCNTNYLQYLRQYLRNIDCNYAVPLTSVDFQRSAPSVPHTASVLLTARAVVTVRAPHLLRCAGGRIADDAQLSTLCTNTLSSYHS
jgi:hypothetical protein